MTILRTTLTAGLLTLATATSAHAAAPWSAPLTLGPPSNGSQAVGLGFSPRGEGLFGWTLGQASYVASIDGDGALGTPTRLPMTLVAGPALAASPPLPTLPQSRRAIVILRRRLPSPPTGTTTPPVDRSRLSWALVRPDGTVGKVRTLSTEQCLSCYQIHLAVNWLGDAVAVWRNDAGDARAAYRPSGGNFEKPITIFKAANGQYPDLAAAVGVDGRAIVVDAGMTVRARSRAPRGGFGRVMRAGRGNGSASVAVSVSNGGQAIVAWGSQDGGEQADEPWIVRTSRLSHRSRRFSATQTLDTGSAIGRPAGRIALAFSPGGKATVAWSAVGPNQTFPVMVAAAGRGGRFAAPQLLAASGAVGGVAVRADGAAVVAWSRHVGEQQPVGVLASVRGPGATAFGAPEEVSGSERAFLPPIVAIDPLTGRPSMAWGARPLPEPLDTVDSSVVHVATRAAP